MPQIYACRIINGKGCRTSQGIVMLSYDRKPQLFFINKIVIFAQALHKHSGNTVKLRLVLNGL